MEFMVSNTAFLNPSMRCLQTLDIPALLQRFSHDDGPVTFSVDSVNRQFQFFTYDSTMDTELKFVWWRHHQTLVSLV